MNWDDLRYLLALASAGSLARAAKQLEVDHTTVGRRIEALEGDLRVRLFTRTTSGYVPTQEAEELLPEIREIEAAMLAIERSGVARDKGLEGAVRITATESFGIHYLAPRLAAFGRANPGVSVELMLGSNIFDLARREADVAVRPFRSKHDYLVVRRAGAMTFSLYATDEYLVRRPAPQHPAELRDHDLLTTDEEPFSTEWKWLNREAPGVRAVFVSNLSLAVMTAALEGAGIAILPCYIGQSEPRLRRLRMPDEPKESIWLTVHRDLQHTRRVRAVLDFLNATLAADRALLEGEPEARSP